MLGYSMYVGNGGTGISMHSDGSTTRVAYGCNVYS